MIHVTDEGVYQDKVDPGFPWPEFVYLTRDSKDETGELSKIVEVWAERPSGSRGELEDGSQGLGMLWLSTGDADGLLGRYTLAAAEKFFRTIPETDHECIRAPAR